jgi:hypothetical protein
MTGLSSRTLCQPLFQRSEILALCSQYILSLKKFLSQNLEIYTFNSTINGFNTRTKLQLKKPSTTLPIYQKGVYYDSINIFNKLPKYIAESFLRKTSFMSNLKKYEYLTDKAFYSIEEYMRS